MTLRLLAASLVLAITAAGAAQAADYRGRSSAAYSKSYETRSVGIYRGYTGNLPSCADPAVQGRVARDFASTGRQYWGSDLELTEFIRPRELGYRSWGHSFIPRRFCSAKVYTSDGRKRQVVYNIAEWQGWGSLSWGVEFCVTGLDRAWAYAPSCKMARP